MNHGEYYYFEVENKLTSILKDVSKIVNIDVLINIDGLPLFNSNKMAVWPILMSIENVKNTKPFAVAM